MTVCGAGRRGGDDDDDDYYDDDDDEDDGDGDGEGDSISELTPRRRSFPCRTYLPVY